MESDIPEIATLIELLNEVIIDGLPHERKKAIMLNLHAVKTHSRQSKHAEMTLNLLDIEDCLGFGKQDHVIDEERLDALTVRLESIALGEEDIGDDDTDSSEPSSNYDPKVVENVQEVASTEKAKLGIELTLCNCSSRDEAREIARGLVESKLAACVNIIANIGSIYQWQGEIVDTSECQLQIKSAPEKREAIASYIKEHHSNDVPEIITVPINIGNVDYLAWVLETTNVETH